MEKIAENNNQISYRIDSLTYIIISNNDKLEIVQKLDGVSEDRVYLNKDKIKDIYTILMNR